METIRDSVRAAERILVPKSRDALSGVQAFSEFTGIEIPESVYDREYVKSDGRSFRLVPGSDMPGQIAAGWGDVALCSTEFCAEAPESVAAYQIGEAMCRYSILALESVADEWQAFLNFSSRYPLSPRRVPASFPKFLWDIVAARDLPLVPMEVPVSGKAEATMRDSGVGAVADRVATGATAKKLGGREIFWLADIYPTILTRRQP